MPCPDCGADDLRSERVRSPGGSVEVSVTYCDTCGEVADAA